MSPILVSDMTTGKFTYLSGFHITTKPSRVPPKTKIDTPEDECLQGDGASCIWDHKCRNCGRPNVGIDATVG